ncbi:Uncharacterised protein [Klebsiella pneumoniae subsp. ozaenae]|uniref:Uncharacterized protein n=1 Tax=Klebsiella pneumoniae subsp. ozaenae TaxID=574 RepID=A0A377ZB25_KLEPO|nr:Uncharacterised protein [Klebsiella pneumoniae subsp. ozaenae]
MNVSRTVQRSLLEKSLRLSNEYFARLVMRRDVAGEVLGKVVRMVLYLAAVSAWLFLLAGNFSRGLDTIKSDGKIPRGLCLAAQSAPLLSP